MQFVNSYATLDTRLFHKQPPTPLTNPQAGHFNPIVAHQIEWDEDDELMDNWVDILSGKFIPDGFEPLAMAYAGHQFGQWAGQLGDGRGLLLAQVVNRDGKLTDLHLKGMGLTPYSRMGDGRAVLRSTIREYLCGHAMSSLGLRSSNALGFVTSETKVRREKTEQGAALMRVADTHIRLGHIEWVASFAPDLLGSFTQYMMTTYYPKLAHSDTPILDFITQVVKRTAIMIADWQLLGFAHGVMNTDNLSITGSTIDYGPFGFLERFNPAWINNHSDHTGRYSYQNQPAIGHWNLNTWMMHFMQLSGKEGLNGRIETINRETLSQCLAAYESTFMRHYQQGLCRKLGLPWRDAEFNPITFNTTNSSKTDDTIDNRDSGDSSLEVETVLEVETINTTLGLAFEFLEILEDNKLDYSNGFRALMAIVESHLVTTATTNSHEANLLNIMNEELEGEQSQRFADWQTKYIKQIKTRLSSSQKHSKEINALSIIELMKNTNPAYVLRNAMAQKAIEQAESGDFKEVDRLFKLLTTPYTVQDRATLADISAPNKDEPPIVISCSS